MFRATVNLTSGTGVTGLRSTLCGQDPEDPLDPQDSQARRLCQYFNVVFMLAVKIGTCALGRRSRSMFFRLLEGCLRRNDRFSDMFLESDLSKVVWQHSIPLRVSLKKLKTRRAIARLSAASRLGGHPPWRPSAEAEAIYINSQLTAKRLLLAHADSLHLQ